MTEIKNLTKRLTRQLASKGVKDAKGMAVALLKKRGDMAANGALTQHGKKRQAMGAAGRAKDRAARESGKQASDFTYNAKTNRGMVKKP